MLTLMDRLYIYLGREESTNPYIWRPAPPPNELLSIGSIDPTDIAVKYPYRWAVDNTVLPISLNMLDFSYGVSTLSLYEGTTGEDSPRS